MDVATETMADGDVVVNGVGADPFREQTQGCGEIKNNEPSIWSPKARLQSRRIIEGAMRMT